MLDYINIFYVPNIDFTITNDMVWSTFMFYVFFQQWAVTTLWSAIYLLHHGDKLSDSLFRVRVNVWIVAKEKKIAPCLG